MKLWKNWKNSEDPEIPPDLVTVNENLWWDPTSGSLPFDFCTESSLHGLKFIGQPKRHFTERYSLLRYLFKTSLYLPLGGNITSKDPYTISILFNCA